MLTNFSLGTLLLAATVSAQVGTNVTDVGLTLDGGPLTVIYGQQCGAFSCTPTNAGPVLAGSTRVVTHWGAASTPYVLALSLASSPVCLSIPGIGNSFALDPATVTLSVGVTAPSGLSTSACRVTPARYSLVMPNSVPPGIQFLLQSVGMSTATRLPAFTKPIDAVTQ